MSDQAETNNILLEATSVVEEKAESFQDKFEGMMALKEQLGRDENKHKNMRPATMLQLKGNSFKQIDGDTNLPDGTFITYNKKGEIDSVTQIITEEASEEIPQTPYPNDYVEVGAE